MCSIGGWYAWGNARPDIETLKGILACGEARGGKNNGGSHDATGIAYLGKDGKIYILKDAISAKEFVPALSKTQWKEIAASPRGLLHNRAITKGSSSDPKNNHPFEYMGWVGVHNGTLTNDEDLFTHFGVKRPAEVDSMAIPLVLSNGKTYEESLAQLSVLDGGCTTALWKVDDPERIAVGRWGGNQLFMWIEPTAEGKIIYWSSALSSGIYMPGIKLGPMTFRYEMTFPENQVVLMGPEKVRTFTLERNPFSLPVQPAATTRRTGPSLTVIDGINQPVITYGGTLLDAATTDGLSPSGKGKRRWGPKHAQVVGYVPEGVWHYTENPGSAFSFKWQLIDQTIVKPSPVWERVSPRWHDRTAIYQYLIKTATPERSSYVATATAYGVWHHQGVVTPEGPVRVTKTFKPAKRMKEFLHKLYGKTPELPVEWKNGPDGPMDRLLPLESFSISERQSTGAKASIVTFGWMCPICGVTESITVWGLWGYRCMGCGIISNVPEKKEL